MGEINRDAGSSPVTLEQTDQCGKAAIERRAWVANRRYSAFAAVHRHSRSRQ